MTSTWYTNPAKVIDESWSEKAQAYQLSLTKPPGALGRLEALAVQFSAFQETLKPELNNIYIAIMAGDHGIADEGVSAFPQAVTGEMIKNFAGGGAAISVLAKYHNATLTVFNTGSVFELPEIEGVVDCRIAAGTANFLLQSAMTEEQCQQALSIGKQAVTQALEVNAQVFVGGEMGIANTSSAACLVAKLLNKSASELAGPGTGLNVEGISHKAKIIQRALEKHSSKMDALSLLTHLGGFEIAALVGAYIHAAQNGLAVLVDGYIASAAALIAVQINPTIKPWLLASHQSAEPAHGLMLQALDLEPLVQLDMRLGEGSGAAIVIPLIQQACILQSQMATFAQAEVSGKSA